MLKSGMSTVSKDTPAYLNELNVAGLDITTPGFPSEKSPTTSLPVSNSKEFIQYLPNKTNPKGSLFAVL